LIFINLSLLVFSAFLLFIVHYSLLIVQVCIAPKIKLLLFGDGGESGDEVKKPIAKNEKIIASKAI